MAKDSMILRNKMEELMVFYQSFSQQQVAGETRVLRVLAIEDSSAHFLLFKTKMLKIFTPEQIEIVHAKSLTKALRVLSRQEIDVVITDLLLPDSEAELTIFRLHSQFPRVPILVLTGADEPQTAVLCMRNGAIDYFVKHRVQHKEVAESLRAVLQS